MFNMDSNGQLSLTVLLGLKRVFSKQKPLEAIVSNYM